MKRIIITFLLASAVVGQVSAQTTADVLRSVEANNKELQTEMHRVASEKIGAKADNNLPDPSVTFSHQYGNHPSTGTQNELIASQSFEFPSVYSRRSELARQKSTAFDRQTDLLRQTVLLRAKELCIDLTMLNKQKQLLDIRRENAEKLSTLYDKRLKTGDANIIETNKLSLELLNVKTEARMIEATRQAKLQELATLNGGTAIDFTAANYDPIQSDELTNFEQLKEQALGADKELLTLASQKDVAQQQIKVNKAKSLPGFQMGYRMNSQPGVYYNGFLVGVTIPLFANKNRVKQAQEQSRFADMQLESRSTAVSGELKQLYDRTVALRGSLGEYDKVMKNQDLTLLTKAIEAGQISMIEYFVNVSTYYQSMQNYLQLQDEYQKAMAELYKFKL